MLRQYELSHDTHTRMICWLEDTPKLKVGSRVTLKGDDDRLWTVQKVYADHPRTAEDLRFHRGWNNNI